MSPLRVKQAVTALSPAIVLATTGEAQAGVNDTKYMSPLKSRQAYLALRFTSTDLTMTAGGLLTVAHGLGVVPKRVYLTLKCVTADATYAVNDLIEVGGQDEGSSQSAGTNVRKDATNVYVRVGGNGMLLLNTSGSGFNIVLANYRLIVTAEL
jgi:hypothetical protein